MKLMTMGQQAVTMSSLHLLELINATRIQFGEAEVRRNDFHERVRDELDGEHYETFVVPNRNGTETVGYQLTIQQSMYVAMRESKGVRRQVQAKLEAKQDEPAFAIPKTMAQALRLAAEQAEQIEEQQKQLALAAPKVDFVDRFVQASTGSRGFREVCKLLKANEAVFKGLLLDGKIMYRLGGKLTAYQQHIDAGRFEVRAGVADNDHAFTTTKFTAKGVEWVAGEWAKHQVREGGVA